MILGLWILLLTEDLFTPGCSLAIEGCQIYHDEVQKANRKGSAGQKSSAANMGSILDTGGAIDYIGSDSSMSGDITC